MAHSKLETSVFSTAYLPYTTTLCIIALHYKHMNQITPIYRFFSKKEHAEDLFLNGNMRFTPVSYFGELEDESYRDKGESFYHIMQRETHKIKIGVKENGEDIFLEGGSANSTHKKLDDAWAFCGTTSIISEARKDFSVVITQFGRLMNKIEESIQENFNERLTLLFGPVAYYDRHMNMFNSADTPPYFSKDKKYSQDFEFRIVIVPTNKMYDETKIFKPLILKIDKPEEVFMETNIINPK